MIELSMFCKLRQFVGKHQEQRYVYGTLLVYISIIVVLSYLMIDSVDVMIQGFEEGGKALEEDETSGGSVLTGFAFLSAILSIFLSSAMIYLSVTGISVTGFLKVGVYAIGSLLIFGLGMVIPTAIVGGFLYLVLSLGLIGAGISDRGLLIFAGAFWEVMLIVSFGGAVALSVWRMNWIFPKDTRHAARKSHWKLDVAVKKIEETREELDGGNFEAASKAFNTARDKLNTVREAKTAVPAVIERIEDLEEELQASATQLVDEAVSATETYADGGQYVTADSTIIIAEEISGHSNIEDDRIGSLREEINSELADIVSREQETMTGRLKQAEHARESGDFDRARDHLEVAEGAYGVIQTIEEDDPNGLGKRLETAHQKIEHDEEAAEIQEYKESIARLLDLDVPQVGIRNGGESAGAYETLYRVAQRLNAPPYSSLPWDEFRAGLIDEMPDISHDRIAEYQRIVSDVEMILSYLDTANEAHPSVHADEWRDAVHTAVEEQYSDVLNPLTSQIKRLKDGGLWNGEDLHRVSWEEFEQLIGLLYEARGYTVNVTKGTADMGVDVWAERRGERVAIQVKQYTDGNTVGRETLQRLTSTIAKGDADKAVVVTSGEFARTAEQYAKDFGPNLEIINGEELIRLLSESNVPPPV